PSLTVPSVSAVEPTPASARVLRPPPSPPREASFIWRWFMGGNTVVRVGVVVLFFGIAFLLKYAYEHTHVPIELRLTGVCVAAAWAAGKGAAGAGARASSNRSKEGCGLGWDMREM
ncbi:MAG: DUF2339 domain-containing protein, partial [Caulobacteraceae bacterium]